MHAKNSSFFLADLLGDLTLQGTQITRSPVARGFIPSQLGGNLSILQSLRIWMNKDLIEAVSGAYRHARRYGYSMTHAANVPSLSPDSQHGGRRRHVGKSRFAALLSPEVLVEMSWVNRYTYELCKVYDASGVGLTSRLGVGRAVGRTQDPWNLCR